MKSCRGQYKAQLAYKHVYNCKKYILNKHIIDVNKILYVKVEICEEMKEKLSC